MKLDRIPRPCPRCSRSNEPTPPWRGTHECSTCGLHYTWLDVEAAEKSKAESAQASAKEQVNAST